MEVTMQCSSCGREITGIVIKGYISVVPCFFCLENIKQEGYVEGYNDGERNAGE